jgi:NitT/TauT family transport system permease protein
MFKQSIKTKTILKNIIIIAIWLGIWQIASMLTGLELILAGPVNVFLSLIKLVQTKMFYIVLGSTTLKIIVGATISFLLAVIIGGIAGMCSLLQDFLRPAVELMKTLPMVAFIILLLIWFGSSKVAAIVSGIVAFPMIYTAITEGIAHTDHGLIEMAKVFRMRPLQKAIYIYMPQIYPYLITNLKVALGMCWKAGISAEVIGLAKNSIGEQMYYSKIYLVTADLFAWCIVVVVISFILEKLILKLLSLLKKTVEEK